MWPFMEDADADSSAHNEQQAATQHTALQCRTPLRPGASEPQAVHDLFYLIFFFLIQMHNSTASLSDAQTSSLGIQHAATLLQSRF